jgi:hypothetical protein
MYSQIVKPWSSLNFINELRDIRNLIKPLMQYRYTDYAFGIAPTVGDSKRLWSNLEKAHAALARLNRNSGKTQKVLFDLPVKPLRLNTIINNCAFMGTPKYTVFGNIVVTMPNMSAAEQDMRLWLDILGVHPDLSTLWEAVPFSWLIDWVVPVGDSISELSDRGWIKPNVTRNISYCYKVRGQYFVGIDGDSFGTAGGTFHYFERGLAEGGAGNQATGSFLNLHRLAILRDVFRIGKKRIRNGKLTGF